MKAIKDVLPAALAQLGSPETLKQQKVFENWTAIAGTKIAPHTKPSLDKRGRLTVWVDQSSLAFELKQRYQQSLLKRAQAVAGEETVKAISFYVGQIR